MTIQQVIVVRASTERYEVIRRFKDDVPIVCDISLGYYEGCGRVDVVDVVYCGAVEP